MAIDEGSAVSVNPDVLRTLESLVEAGVSAYPRGELEIGGLLLGYEGYDGFELRLEAVHAIAFEHLFGPSYQLSDSDIKLIEQAISQLSSHFWLRIAGHFRSHTKGELEITAADRTIAALTGTAEPLVLLIQGSSIGPSLARLYRGSGDRCVELLEFSLAPVASRPPVPPEEAPPQEPAAPGPPDSDIALTQAECPVLQVSASPEPPSPGPPDSKIGQNPAERRAAVWHSVWQNSAHGSTWKSLSVTGLLACVALVFYLLLPSSPRPRADVKKQLGLSIRHADEVVAAPPEPIAKPLVQDRTANLPITKKEHPPARPLRRRPQKSPPEMEPPDAFESSATDGSPHAQSSESTPEILPAPLVAQAPRIPGSSPIPAPSGVAIAPPEPAPSTISYVAPIPVHKTSPSVPANLRPLIQDGVSIEVKVAIDTQGQVVSATPLHVSNSNWKLLSPIAVQAALFWRFEPARQNGKPVGSETVLKFNFEPRTH